VIRSKAVYSEDEAEASLRKTASRTEKKTAGREKVKRTREGYLGGNVIGISSIKRTRPRGKRGKQTRVLGEKE